MGHLYCFERTSATKIFLNFSLVFEI